MTTKASPVCRHKQLMYVCMSFLDVAWASICRQTVVMVYVCIWMLATLFDKATNWNNLCGLCFCAFLSVGWGTLHFASIWTAPRSQEAFFITASINLVHAQSGVRCFAAAGQRWVRTWSYFMRAVRNLPPSCQCDATELSCKRQWGNSWRCEMCWHFWESSVCVCVGGGVPTQTPGLW